jgi:hypothetical protein
MTARKLGMLTVVTALLTLGGAGCDRTYLTPTHGRAYRQIFAVQTVNPDRKADPNAVHGLDSQEASIIAHSYRKGLSPKDDSAVSQQQLLMYSPRAGLRDTNMPPPSVPSGER